MRSARAVIVAATLVIASASPAVAQDVRGPDDGATVTSEPVFSFDPATPYARVELSRTADLSADGTFVDAAYTDFFVLDREPRDGIARWRDGRIAAGTYLWHARVDDASYRSGPWSPLRRLTVADEPPRFNGMTLDTRRLRPIGRCARVRLRGKVAWSDNDTEAKGTLRLSLGTATVAATIDGSDEFSTIACSRGAVSTVRVVLVDRIGQATLAPDRGVTIPAGLPTISPSAGKKCAPVVLYTRSTGIRQTGTACTRARALARAWMLGAPAGGCAERDCPFRGYTCASRERSADVRTYDEVECRRPSGRVRFVHRSPG